MSDVAAMAAVQRGIEALDRFGPDDWRDRIVVRRLALSKTCGCVCGQVFGNWNSNDTYKFLSAAGRHRRPAAVFAYTTPTAQRLGFMATPQYSYGELTTAWKRALRRERALQTHAERDTDLALSGD